MFYYEPKIKPNQIKIDEEISPVPLEELGIVPQRKLIVTSKEGIKMIKLLTEDEFYEKYCQMCGSQRCEGIGTSWFDGCGYKYELKGYEESKMQENSLCGAKIDGKEERNVVR